MRTLFLIVIATATATLSAAGQATAGMSAGISNGKTVLQGEIGYSFKSIYTGFDIRSHIYKERTAHIGAKTVYFFRIGDFHAGPSVGYYKRMVSTDNKSLNGFDTGYGIKAGYKWISIECFRVGHFTQFSIGVFAFIIPKEG